MTKNKYSFLDKDFGYKELVRIKESQSLKGTFYIYGVNPKGEKIKTIFGTIENRILLERKLDENSIAVKEGIFKK